MEAKFGPATNPKKFKRPNIIKYSETWDPRDCVMTYMTKIMRNDLTKDEIRLMLVKKFGETMAKGTLTGTPLTLKFY